MKTVVLFDLDGTLLDTLPGLAASTNAALRAHGEPALTTEKPKGKHTWVVTALDRCWNESAPVQVTN